MHLSQLSQYLANSESNLVWLYIPSHLSVKSHSQTSQPSFAPWSILVLDTHKCFAQTLATNPKVLTLRFASYVLVFINLFHMFCLLWSYVSVLHLICQLLIPISPVPCLSNSTIYHLFQHIQWLPNIPNVGNPCFDLLFITSLTSSLCLVFVYNLLVTVVSSSVWISTICLTNPSVLSPELFVWTQRTSWGQQDFPLEFYLL